MNFTRRRGATAFFIVMGVCLIGLLISLNITWIHLSGRSFAIGFVGIILFLILIAGVVLNTVFLVREIRRNERQDSFLNAVTHELKTPIASIRLYLDTLSRHPGDEVQRQHFYSVMRSDTDRLLSTVESVLKAGELGHRNRVEQRTRIELFPLVADCIATVRSRHHLAPEAIQLAEIAGGVRLHVIGNIEDLRTAVLNLLDNAVKYSPSAASASSAIPTSYSLLRTPASAFPRRSSSESSSVSIARLPTTALRLRVLASVCSSSALSHASTAAMFVPPAKAPAKAPPCSSNSRWPSAIPCPASKAKDQ